MDAPEADKDVKLYRASADLLPEIRDKLPKLVRHCGKDKHGRVRKWVLQSKTEEIIERLDRFQEWPQLLDPHLADFVQILVDAFLSYISTSGDAYARQPTFPNLAVLPLPRAVSRLLYVFCKVRGQKIIVRLLKNEPKYLEPLLTFMARWNASRQTELGTKAFGMVWEERYLLLLWMSHLMLTPFDLSSVSSVKIGTLGAEFTTLTVGLPNIAVSLLSIALDHLFVPSKEREAACALLVRLFLRSDMQTKQLLERGIRFAIESLDRENRDATVTPYHYVGLLSLLSGVVNSGADEDVAPFIRNIFALSLRLATGQSQHQLAVRSSAPARKLLIKTMRSALIHAIYLNSKATRYVHTEDLDAMLEEAIQYLLEALSDKDTPIRMAASKNLAMVVLKLDDSMSAEVVQAVLDSLNENVLLENLETGAVVSFTEVSASQAAHYRRNISAVDPLKWQGLMLTLGHLLFRRSPPPHQLPTIIEALISGLHFEQRSNVGTSVGVGVRDAACFGVWSLARKYNTDELKLVTVGEIRESAAQMLVPARPQNVLQMIATELVISACTDPSGNIRRGSSAALQELIGRHPDTVTAGIPLVQIVDYHAVARRSRAICEVAIETAKLDSEYHIGLLNALMDWRGAKAADPDSRRLAASAVGDLVENISRTDIDTLCKAIINRVHKLKPVNMGNAAELRHGLLLTVSHVIDTVNVSRVDAADMDNVLSDPFSEIVLTIWKSLAQLVGNQTGRVTRDLELVLEATSRLVYSLATFRDETRPGIEALSKTIGITERCITASEKDHVVDAASAAASALFRILDQDARSKLVGHWISLKNRKTLEYRSKGRVQTIGQLLSLLPARGPEADLKASMLEYLKDLTADSWPIETRVNAMKSLTSIIPSTPTTARFIEELRSVIIVGLTDYTIDQRGDVGSTLRFESISAVQQILISSPTNQDTLKPFIQEVVKLAVEKLSKIRLRAWTCLMLYWDHDPTFPPLPKDVSHISDVSSSTYYASLLALLQVPWLQKHLVLGLVSSAAAGTEDIGRASCEALVSYLLALSGTERQATLHLLLEILAKHLSTCAVADDRNVIPALEFFGFLVEQGMLSSDPPQTADDDYVGIWTAMQKVHNPTVSIQRLEAITKIYSALCTSKTHKIRALDKLTLLLLHRYPKIRAGAADSVFLHTQSEQLIACDWTVPVTQLKPIVLQLRRELGVTAPIANSFSKAAG